MPDSRQPEANAWQQMPALLKLAHEERLALQRGLAHVATQLYRYKYSRNPVLQLGSATLHWIGGRGKPVLFVPSHINRGYILAVDQQNSLACQLADAGYATYILEWNSPTLEENDFGMSEYITQRLQPVMAYLIAEHGTPPVLAGYCMGGLIAIAAAVLYPNMVRGLATIATPFDFNQQSFPYIAPHPNSVENLGDATHKQPISKSAIHTMILMPQIYNINRKLINLGHKLTSDPQGGGFERTHAMVETWTIDGIDMSWPVFQDCVVGWLHDNAPYRKEWSVAGQQINPAQVQAPSFSAIAVDDDIVPFSSALPLSSALRNNKLVHKQTGHLGLILSQKHGVLQELMVWLAGLTR